MHGDSEFNSVFNSPQIYVVVTILIIRFSKEFFSVNILYMLS